MFIVRLDEKLWRVISNVPHMLDRLPNGTTYGKPAWESDFGISSLLADRLQEGNIYLAGDAAHIHSGLGARGMNLGIEDAYVFATLASEERLTNYERLRHPIDKSVVQQTERITEVPRGKKPFAKVARTLIPFIAPFISLGQTKIAEWVLGLDHEVQLY
jgi:2-polyprenyl-6-methoxyphenol hydroxylase-like FAD-dependent oxidoreductase